MSDLPKPIADALDFFHQNQDNENIGYWVDFVGAWIDGYRNNLVKEKLGDTRIVYGVNCSWWDSIDKVAVNAASLPCCPHCKGVLMEVIDEETWWANQAPNANRGVIEWSRGKCFSSVLKRDAAYLKARGMGTRKVRAG